MFRLGIALTVLTVGGPSVARAQVMPGIDEWAAAVAGQIGRWGGQRVDEPVPRVRPDAEPALRSMYRPLDVHAAEGIAEDRVDVALAALEAAYDGMRALGWDPPAPDGGRGGTAGFDLYLVRQPERMDDAQADTRVSWSYLDSAAAFGVVDGDLPDDMLAACTTSAYAQAVLLGQDPAEAETVRHATATYLTRLLTGSWGCDENAVREQQREPHRAWIGDGVTEGDGGAIFLAHVGARHDGGSGAFVHDAWQVARQRTWEGYGLRGSPDLWEAIEALVELTEDTLDEIVESLAVRRWLLGRASADEPGAILPDGARVTEHASARWAELPRRTPPADPPLDALGSGYVRIDVRGAPHGAQLEVWLAGEYGVRWSLVALRLDERGRELGRMTAPARRRPESYLLLELVDGTAEVILIVTNLGSRIADADEPAEDGRSYRVIMDRS